MRFLIDTNILLYAANNASPFHAAAHGFLRETVRSRAPWCTTGPILYEFLRVSTHRRVFAKPLDGLQALEFLAGFISVEEVSILGPTARHLETLREVMDGLMSPQGNLFHDIHTATLMREHGVPEIVTADADFFQFRFLKVTNPLRSPAV